MKNIGLKEISGYATERTVWRLIHDLASTGTSSLWKPTNEEPVDAWTIGAKAFYALMGVEVFESNGRAAQTASTPVPRISASHCSPQLGLLIHRCLAFSANERPSLQELAQESQKVLDTPTTPSRRLSTSSGVAYRTSLVKFWPEEFCLALIMLFLMFIPLRASAQVPQPVPDEMTAIIKRCIDLRQPSNATNVERDFTYDTKWTLMDELDIDRNGECTERDKVFTLGVNRIGYRIAKLNSGVSNAGGRFRNGQDPRYKYSFIEVTAKRGATLGYDITGREGEQVFAVMPGVDAVSFTAKMTLNGKSVGQAKLQDGVMYIFINEAIRTTDILHLAITNSSGQNMSFVIVNYNSRTNPR